ncbi:MAG: efflux RND transporter periplasmic adaptor subunit [Nitrospirales bacterium]
MLTSETPDAKGKRPPAKQSSALDTIRGIIKPAVRATLSSEIQARIVSLPFSNGQRFKKGQTLVTFDCSKYSSELAVAKAEYEARRKTLENSLELSQFNAIGQLEVDIARVDVKKAVAAINVSKIIVQHCHIDAPFSGRVVKTLVNQYESVNPYDELLSILDDSQFEIELILPSSSLRWIKKGAPFQFTVDETAKTYAASVTELGASIDPVSQTIRVTGTFKKKLTSVLSGMSGNAVFPEKPQTISKPKPTSQKVKTQAKVRQRETRKKKILSIIKE